MPRSSIAGLLLLVTAAAGAQPFAVTEHTLANGMKILVHEDHDIPSVAFYLFFRVGSRNERPGATGISHFFEHMMFKGSGKFGAGQFDAILERHGGSNNAYTTNDLTVFTDWVPPSALPLLMEMEADRLQSLRLDPESIEIERGVVASERRSTVDSNHFELLLELLYATAFRVHPYRWPVIGWAADIQAWTHADLKKHFRMGYAPNNCLMVVVGDVRSSEVLALARKHFEPLPRQDPPPPVTGSEPEQTGERRVTLERAAESPIQLFAYHVPGTAHADYWPLQFLGTVLAYGRSSRLDQRLVHRRRLALAVSSWQYLTLDPGLLLFSAEPRRGADLAALESAFLQELERVRSGSISLGELRRARNQLLTYHLRETRTNSGKADLLGRYEIYFGGYRRLFSVAEELDRVTVQDIQRVARTYLRPANRTVATLLPAARKPPESGR